MICLKCHCPTAPGRWHQMCIECRRRDRHRIQHSRRRLESPRPARIGRRRTRHRVQRGGGESL
jgi:hypothetical protein